MDFININEILIYPQTMDFNGFKEKKDFELISLFGKISCGKFGVFDGDIEGYLEIPNRYLGAHEYFALKAKGDSMINAGIYDGDLIIVQKQSSAQDGQIAVVMHNNEVVLKRFYKLTKEKKYLLHPENNNFDDIIVDSCMVLGIAVKIIKELK